MGRPRVAFVVNGGSGSAMAVRAESFAARLAADFDVRTVYRAGSAAAAARRMLGELARIRPAGCYVFDLAVAGVVAAGLYRRATGTRFAVDTGDAVVDLGRVLGRGPAGMLATRLLEAFALRGATRVVVRGSYHRELLAARGVAADFVPDGVDLAQFALPVPRPRDPAGPLVIGLVGSSVRVPYPAMSYGWELVELVRILLGRLPVPVRGVMVGGGTGVPGLRQRAAEIGIADAVEFVDRVPYPDLPSHLGRIDVCLSTQTNDRVGNVRTTGKLPLYLAAGRFVLASRVGEAARVLPPEMLVGFAGRTDPDYPARLAARVEELWAAGTDFGHRPDCVRLAREHFDYDGLAPRVGRVLAALVGRHTAPNRA